MITEDKVTEIFCIANDFIKVFDAQMVKHTFYGRKKAQVSPWKPHVKGGNHGDNDSLSFIRISLLEAFLSRKGMQAHAPSVSWGGILQPMEQREQKPNLFGLCRNIVQTRAESNLLGYAECRRYSTKLIATEEDDSQPFRWTGTWDCHPIDSVLQEGSSGL